jgi:hypothetical protein
MNDPLIWFAFAVAIGFTISAIVSHSFAAVTKTETPFRMDVTSDVQRVAMVGLLLLAGPHILFRAANRSRIIGDWPLVYVWASYGLGAMWSFILGFTLLSIITI